MKIIDIKISKILEKIYASIEGDIQCLQQNLSAELPEAASRKWHDNVWDVDDYARLSCSCTAIETLLYLINDLKIPKHSRDLGFEKIAQEWANIA